MLFRLRYQGRNLELEPGQFVIGRSPDCHLCLDDSRVSRRHALLIVERQGIELEDLGSRNGVKVNGKRVVGRKALELGDVLIVSGHELVLEGTQGPDATTVNQVAPTKPSEAFSMLSDLADKALALGRGEEAERLLTINLLSVLEDLREARPVPREIAERAAFYGAKLARATKHGRWFDYALRMYAHLQAPCANETLDELYAAAKGVDQIDLRLVADCLGQLGSHVDLMPAGDRFLFARMQGLERLCRLRDNAAENEPN